MPIRRIQCRSTPLITSASFDAWNEESLGRGEKLYQGICITCYGNLTQAGSLPTSRPFWKEPFKNGNDPLSLYRTLSLGFGQMPAWTFLTPVQRYDTIHYIRETFVKPHNPTAYFAVTSNYLSGLPQGTGTGRIFVVPQQNIGGQLQGGVVQLPIPDFPTGVMRGRLHPKTGDLYACGMYAWAGNRQSDGGFYRVRATDKPSYLPIGIHGRTDGIQLDFTDRLDAVSAADPRNYSVKVWSLKRSANYGSKHLDEHALEVTRATLDAN